MHKLAVSTVVSVLSREPIWIAVDTCRMSSRETWEEHSADVPRFRSTIALRSLWGTFTPASWHRGLPAEVQKETSHV